MTSASTVQLARQVEFADTDASGRIHFTAAFRWAEQTEHELIRTLGVTDVAKFPRVNVGATYRASLIAGVKFVLELGVARIGTTSITYAWRGVGDGVTYFDGHHTVVHIDLHGESIALPTRLAQLPISELAWKQENIHDA